MWGARPASTTRAHALSANTTPSAGAAPSWASNSAATGNRRRQTGGGSQGDATCPIKSEVVKPEADTEVTHTARIPARPLA